MLNNMLSGIMIAIAVLLLVASGRIDDALDNVQVNSDIDRANKGIYTIGIIMLTAGVTLLAAQKKVDVEPMILTGLIGVLGLVLLVLAAIVINKGSGSAKSWGVCVLVGGIVFLVASGAIIGMEHKDKIKKLVHGFGDDDSDDDGDNVGYFVNDDDTSSDGSDAEFEFACY
jgi:hypothetical protein